MRNFEKAVEQGKAFIGKHEQANLSLTEINTMYGSFKETAAKKGIYDALWDVIAQAFYAGVAIGKRNA